MDNSKWVYYTPEFECDQVQPEVYLYSPWVGHRRFAYDFVRNVKINRIVELGSYYGCSAFAFLQAIKDGGLDTIFYGVDTWQGDSFTENDYQEDIYGHYKTVNDRFFGNVNSVMVRELFDNAVEKFEDGSIDLLHIDGSHTYEDVKNDYLKWKQKVAANGIIFFHDIGADAVFDEPYGSHYFWEELKEKEQFTMEMLFSHGLGILFLSEQTYQIVKEKLDVSVYQNYVNLQDSLNKDVIRKDYFKIRDLQNYNADLKNQIVILNEHLEKYSKDMEAKREYISDLEKQKTELNEHLEKYSKDMEAKQEYISDLEKQKAELNEHLDKYSEDVLAKKNYIFQLEKNVADLNAFASDKEKYIQELLGEKESLIAFAESKEYYINKLEGEIAELKKLLTKEEA